MKNEGEFHTMPQIYSKILERKFEIAILRSLGLKSRDVRNMFLLESMIILLSAGILGTIIGAFCAYLLLSNIAILLEIPLIFVIPAGTLFRVFGLSITIGTLGIFIILRKLSKESIMDIFREAF